MAKATNIELKGFKELMKQFKQLDGLVALSTVQSALRKAFKVVEADAKALAPKRTGALSKSIRIAIQKPKSGSVFLSAGLTFRKKVKLEVYSQAAAATEMEVTGAAARWHWAEFGIPSRGIPAKPFLRPAFVRNKDALLAILKVEMKKKLEQKLKKIGNG